MKKAILFYLTLSFFLTFTKYSNAQQIIKTDKEIYSIERDDNFIITKSDINTKKVIFKVETIIPNKSLKEIFYPSVNNASFEIINENMVIVYDVWQKSKTTKDCYIKLLNVNSGKFDEPKLVYSTKLNSVYSSNEVIYKSIYSPDKTKLAIIKDNISPSYDIDSEINIYDTKTFNILSSKKISGRYEGQKRIFDLTNISIDNNGNIITVFHLLNETTKITTKSFSADILFTETDLKNIKELNNNISSIDSNENSHGQFYKTFDDYINDKSIPGVRIKNGSFNYLIFRGINYKLIDDNGNLKSESSKTLPSELFTYKNTDTSYPFLMRIIDKKPYIVLVAGKLNYYSQHLYQDKRFYSVGWNGKLKKFNENHLEKYLKKYNLLKDYKKDKPKREFRDGVNEYFNKVVNWEIKYFNLLNEKM